MTHTKIRNPQQRFSKLVAEAHYRSGKNCIVAADLARIAPSYLSDLVAGKRQRVSFPVLRLFEARLAIEPGDNAVLPVEVYWRIARFASTRDLANAAGIDRSYLTRIMQGGRRPSLDVVTSLCVTLGFDPGYALRLYGKLSIAYTPQCNSTRRCHSAARAERGVAGAYSRRPSPVRAAD
jgi:transcriptional regulator with XRE-family HTH domain